MAVKALRGAVISPREAIVSALCDLDLHQLQRALHRPRLAVAHGVHILQYVNVSDTVTPFLVGSIHDD